MESVCNDHLYNKFINCDLFNNIFDWRLKALGHLDELQKAEKYPIRWSL